LAQSPEADAFGIDPRLLGQHLKGSDSIVGEHVEVLHSVLAAARLPCAAPVEYQDRDPPRRQHLL